jgi:hypothetical protein
MDEAIMVTSKLWIPPRNVKSTCVASWRSAARWLTSETRVRSDIGQSLRSWIVDEHAEHSSPARQIADRPLRRLSEPRSDEAFQLDPRLVEYAQRCVSRTRQRLRLGEDAIKHGGRCH